MNRGVITPNLFFTQYQSLQPSPLFILKDSTKPSQASTFLATLISLFTGTYFTKVRRGQGGIRTPEGVSQQIYSLPVLTTYLPTQFSVSPECHHTCFLILMRRTPGDTCSVLLLTHRTMQHLVIVVPMLSHDTQFIARTLSKLFYKLLVGVARIELTSNGPKPSILTVIPYPELYFKQLAGVQRLEL